MGEFVVRHFETGEEFWRLRSVEDFLDVMENCRGEVILSLNKHRMQGHFSFWLESIGEERLAGFLKGFEAEPFGVYVKAVDLLYHALKEKRIGFSEVVGSEGVKSMLRARLMDPDRASAISEKYRRRRGGGVLFYGPPGCGKTHTANALAGETSRVFLRESVPEILECHGGASALRNLFDVVRKIRDNVLFLDEVECATPDRDSESNYWRATTSAFLTQMDFLSEQDDGVFVIGATNAPWRIDPAMLRSGRLETLVYMGVPDMQTRTGLFEFYARGLPLGQVDFDELAGKSAFYSCSDVKAVCEEAAAGPWKEALESGKARQLEQEDFERALEQTCPTGIAWFENATNVVCPETLKRRFAPMFKQIDEYARWRE